MSFQRYSLRKDGFVSASAPMAVGWLVTKPIVFAGNVLKINFETSAAGSIRVETQTADGTPLAGLELEDCRVEFGNRLAHVVAGKTDHTKRCTSISKNGIFLDCHSSSMVTGKRIRYLIRSAIKHLRVAFRRRTTDSPTTDSPTTD